MFFDSKLPRKITGETRIAHLSDLHIAHQHSELRDRTRRFLKRPIADNCEWTALLLADAAQHDIDHLVITGDLSNNGQEPQFAQLRELLGGYDDPARLTVVPGNHDISYREFIKAGRRSRRRPAKLTAFLNTFGHLIPDAYPPGIGLEKTGFFPIVKFVGEDAGIALIGLDTTSGFTTRVPGLNSLGKVSRAQFADLKALLRSPAIARRVKVVLMHHHPMIVPFHDWLDNFKLLRNAKKLLDLLYTSRVDLILHGHKHQPFCWQSHTFDEHNFSVICAGPPDAYGNGATRPKELVYNIYALREGTIHVHYQRCPIPAPRHSFRYSRRGGEAAPSMAAARGDRE